MAGSLLQYRMENTSLASYKTGLCINACELLCPDDYKVQLDKLHSRHFANAVCAIVPKIDKVSQLRADVCPTGICPTLALYYCLSSQFAFIRLYFTFHVFQTLCRF